MIFAPPDSTFSLYSIDIWYFHTYPVQGIGLTLLLHTHQPCFPSLTIPNYKVHFFATPLNMQFNALQTIGFSYFAYHGCEKCNNRFPITLLK